MTSYGFEISGIINADDKESALDILGCVVKDNATVKRITLFDKNVVVTEWDIK